MLLNFMNKFEHKDFLYFLTKIVFIFFYSPIKTFFLLNANTGTVFIILNNV